MSFSAVFEENKVQNALRLLREDSSMTIADAAREARASYWRVYRRVQGGAPSNSRGGHNQKLKEP